MVIGTAIVLSRDWLKALSVPLLFAGNGTPFFWSQFWPFISAIGGGCVRGCGFGMVGLAVPKKWPAVVRVAVGVDTRARWLLLSASIVCGLMMAEAAAAAWLSWTHRLPAWPRRLPCLGKWVTRS